MESPQGERSLLFFGWSDPWWSSGASQGQMKGPEFNPWGEEESYRGGPGNSKWNKKNCPAAVDTEAHRGLPACQETPQPGDFRGAFLRKGRAPSTGLLLLPVSLSLEVSVGKATTIYAVNGTEILLPCTFSSCFGFEDLRFWWSYNSSDTSRIVSRGKTVGAA